MAAGDDIVNITFDDSVTGSYGTSTITGTISVDYTNSTATGMLYSSGSVPDAYDMIEVDSLSNGEGYVVSANGISGVNSIAISYSQTNPAAVRLMLQNRSGEYSYNFDAPVTSTTVCFAAGTLIRTARGDVAVEALRVGEHVVTSSGTLRPIRWLGHRGYIGRFANGNPEVLPICFKAGSLAEGVPARDLCVSPNHAMFFDGVLIPAKCLVNGASVTQAESVESVEYWHVELDSHDVLIAEGAAAESFVGDDGRNIFHNVHEYYALYPDAIDGEAVYCASRVESGYTLDAVRRRINQRAGLAFVEPLAYGELRGEFTSDGVTVTGWAQNGAFPDAPVCLDILVDGRLVKRAYACLFDADLLRAGIGDGRHAFHAMLSEPLAGPRAIAVCRSVDGAILGVEQLVAKAA